MALADGTRPGVEHELRKAMLTGRLVDWHTGDTRVDDLARGADWDAQRTVAGAFLVNSSPAQQTSLDQAKAFDDL
jgi:hypothetical protein